MTETQGLTSCL